ncbi:MAG: hypothetical protein AB7K68_10385 [Bacteriovoracia bacterium]
MLPARPARMKFQVRKWSPLEHGGIVRKGQRKRRRYMDVSRTLHLVMRSTKARGHRSFINPRNKGVIHLLLIDTANRYEIKIYNYVNVGNHLHLHVRGWKRKNLQAFLKVFPQRVMFHVTGARKGRPRGKFFDEIVYSRVVNWGGDFKRVKEYFWKNTLEALGFSHATIVKWRRAARIVPP